MSDSYYLFYTKTRRQLFRLRRGWVCRVFDFFNQIVFETEKKLKSEAVAAAKEFEVKFKLDQEAAKERFKAANRKRRNLESSENRWSPWKRRREAAPPDDAPPPCGGLVAGFA